MYGPTFLGRRRQRDPTAAATRSAGATGAAARSAAATGCVGRRQRGRQRGPSTSHREGSEVSHRHVPSAPGYMGCGRGQPARFSPCPHCRLAGPRYGLYAEPLPAPGLGKPGWRIYEKGRKKVDPKTEWLKFIGAAFALGNSASGQPPGPVSTSPPVRSLPVTGPSIFVEAERRFHDPQLPVARPLEGNSLNRGFIQWCKHCRGRREGHAAVGQADRLFGGRTSPPSSACLALCPILCLYVRVRTAV